MGWYLDGRASVVFGTTPMFRPRMNVPAAWHCLYHQCRHVRSMDSVIGMEKDTVIRGFLNQLPREFEVAEDNVALQGIVVDVDENDGKARSIRRLRLFLDAQS
jgi:calcineurin-like phosphoesterase